MTITVAVAILALMLLMGVLGAVLLRLYEAWRHARWQAAQPSLVEQLSRAKVSVPVVRYHDSGTISIITEQHPL